MCSSIDLNHKKKSQVKHKRELTLSKGKRLSHERYGILPSQNGMRTRRSFHSRGNDPLMKQALKISTWTLISYWFQSGTATICPPTQ